MAHKESVKPSNALRFALEAFDWKWREIRHLTLKNDIQSDDVGWNVTETAARRGCERGTLSRLLNGKAGVSANMAQALENIGWGSADHWIRMQASYELAQGGRDRAAAERRAVAVHA